MTTRGPLAPRVLLLGGEETRFHRFEAVVPPLCDQLEASGCDVRLGIGGRALTRDNLFDRDLIVSITTGGTLVPDEERALLAAVPDPGLRSLPAVLEGEMPSPTAPPSGCRFRTRCAHAISLCAERVPPAVSVSGHRAACHRRDELGDPAEGVR